MSRPIKDTLNKFISPVAILLLGKLTNIFSNTQFVIMLVIMIILALGYFVIFAKKKPSS